MQFQFFILSQFNTHFFLLGFLCGQRLTSSRPVTRFPGRFCRCAQHLGGSSWLERVALPAIDHCASAGVRNTWYNFIGTICNFMFWLTLLFLLGQIGGLTFDLKEVHKKTASPGKTEVVLTPCGYSAAGSHKSSENFCNFVRASFQGFEIFCRPFKERLVPQWNSRIRHILGVARAAV